MEAELVRELPEGDWQYEPKWDGFRGVLENDGGELALWSRNERPLLRYFPELAPLGDSLPPHSALDGEIVIAREGALDFDAMQLRLHPAESRIRRLAAETPAQFVVFDVLLWDGEPVWELPLEERRSRLERLKGFRLSPASRDVADARRWLEQLDAAGLDGVVAKRLGLPDNPGSRAAVVKVKENKTADCVVAGVRWRKGSRTLATLLLGLYDDNGHLDYVGSTAVAASKEQEIRALVEPLLEAAPDRRFSEANRWGTGELEEAAIRPELVVEVRYDKVQGNRSRHNPQRESPAGQLRFRHGTRLIRFRPDKEPAACTWDGVLPPRGPDDLTVEKLLGTP